MKVLLFAIGGPLISLALMRRVSFLLPLFLVGCAGVNVNALYPDYAARKASVTHLIGFSDIQALEDGLEGGAFLNVKHNVAIAEQLNKQMRAILEKKGYELSAAHSFVSLAPIDPETFRVKVRAEQAVVDAGPPYYADPAFTAGEGEIEILKQVFEEFSAIGQKTAADSPVQYLPAVPKLKEIRPADVFLLHQAYGKHVGFTKQLMEGIGSGIATLGMWQMYHLGGQFSSVCLVDGTSGEILWMSAANTPSGFGGKSDQRSLLKAILSDLPSR